MNTSKRILFVWVSMVVCALPLQAQATPREIVDKAVPYLKADGQTWIKKRGCVSCHQIPAMVWSLRAAVDGRQSMPAELAELSEWSVQVANFVKPAQRKDLDVESTMAGNIDTMAAMLLALPGDQKQAWRKQFTRKLVSEQAEDGSWKPCGQLPAQKRPPRETREATTLWVTLALLRADSEDFDLASAIQFAGSSEDAKSTERVVVGLLVADSLSGQSLSGQSLSGQSLSGQSLSGQSLSGQSLKGLEQASQLRQRLLNSQNEDGGWGWIIGEPSDALATGLALYGLGRTGSTDSRQITAAHRFLASTQNEDGSWKVPGTKKSATGKATETANYWGTAWAVIGLTNSS